MHFCITGPVQFIRQRGQRLLTNENFKDQLPQFLVKEWQQNYYWYINQGKILFVFYGGNCFQYVPDQINLSRLCPSSCAASRQA